MVAIENEGHPADSFAGAQLRKRRKQVGWTLTDLAKKLNISYQQVQKYEQGNSRMTASVLYDLTQILGVNANYFFDGFAGSNTEDETEIPSDVIDVNADKPFNVLIIEDDPSDILLMRNALTACGREVKNHIIHDGEQALEFVNDLEQSKFPRPDIIFLDLNIPKKNGFDILNHIKKNQDILDIPVVVITNSISRNEMLRVYQAFASGYICKSFDYEVFERHIASIIDYWANTVVLPNRN